MLEDSHRKISDLEKKLNRHGLRFCVGCTDVGYSGIWSAFSKVSDYYVGVRGILGMIKISLHASGICRLALTDHHASFLQSLGMLPLEDRAFIKWRRVAAPEAGAHLALVLVFPTDHLHSDDPKWENSRKPLFIFKPAAAGKALEFGFFYSREAKETLEAKLIRIGTPLFFS
jgi:hypothetical protein